MRNRLLLDPFPSLFRIPRCDTFMLFRVIQVDTFPAWYKKNPIRQKSIEINMQMDFYLEASF